MRQLYSLAGESPAVPIARFRHVAMPQLLGVTPSPLRGVNGAAAWESFPAVGTTGESSKCGSLNIKEMTAAPKSVPH
jgi:hypothetical protein